MLQSHLRLTGHTLFPFGMCCYCFFHSFVLTAINFLLNNFMYQFNVDQTTNRIKLGSFGRRLAGCKVVVVVLLTFICVREDREWKRRRKTTSYKFVQFSALLFSHLKWRIKWVRTVTNGYVSNIHVHSA